MQPQPQLAAVSCQPQPQPQLAACSLSWQPAATACSPASLQTSWHPRHSRHTKNTVLQAALAFADRPQHIPMNSFMKYNQYSFSNAVHPF